MMLIKDAVLKSTQRGDPRNDLCSGKKAQVVVEMIMVMSGST